jgi:hypothetical protein
LIAALVSTITLFKQISLSRIIDSQEADCSQSVVPVGGRALGMIGG